MSLKYGIPCVSTFAALFLANGVDAVAQISNVTTNTTRGLFDSEQPRQGEENTGPFWVRPPSRRLDLNPGPVQPSVGAASGAPLAGTSQIGTPAAAPAPLGSSTFLRWGIADFHPHLAYQISYGDNLQSRAGQQANTVIHQFSPGLLVNIGDYWTVDYTPTMRWYSDSQFEDGVDHSVYLTGRATYKEWTFGLSQSFAKTSQPLVETAAQTEEETWATALSATRPLNEKLFVDLGLSQNFRFVGGSQTSLGLSDSKQWSTMDWLGYQHTPKLAFGVGAGFTYDNVQFGSDMTSEQVQARVTYRPGNKLSLELSGGLDIRQFIDSDISDMVSPIFAFTANYQLFENTAIFVSASRTVSPSYYQDAVSESTGLNAGITQRLLGKVFLTVSGGQSTRDYTDTGALGGAVAQNQDTYSVGASLGMAFLERGYVSLFYSKSWNDSGSQAFNFDPQTVGAQISYRF